jgi:hypothetical protein
VEGEAVVQFSALELHLLKVAVHNGPCYVQHRARTAYWLETLRRASRHTGWHRRGRPCARHEGIWLSGGTAPLILNLSAKRRWVVTFTTQPLHLSFGTTADIHAVQSHCASVPTRHSYRAQASLPVCCSACPSHTPHRHCSKHCTSHATGLQAILHSLLNLTLRSWPISVNLRPLHLKAHRGLSFLVY